jgi:two-component system, NtrC family, response regulator HydG
MTNHRVLVVDDHLEMARTVADYLKQHGAQAETAASAQEALAMLGRESFDALLTDLRMKGMDGLDLLDAAHRLDSELPVVVMTAFGGIDSAVESIQRGAYHYVTKPFKLEVVRVLLERACRERDLHSENRRLRRAVDDRFADILGRCPPMQALFALLERVAQVGSPALVLGETGTGKELVARALHHSGPRQGGPFVAVNCAALPETLLESELYGHTRGAFTGATQARRGLFLDADGGTLLLDEIGELSPPLQARLLRVLESGEVRPLGSDAVRTVDVRVVAATHQPISELVATGRFREDLFFRLNVLPIVIPPLRERGDDIRLLAEHFLAKARERVPQAKARAFASDGIAALLAHPWPGNVRELEHLVERLVVTTDKETVDGAAVRAALALPLPALRSASPFGSFDPLPTLRDLEQQYIDHVLDRTEGNKTRAADILGIDPSTLHRRSKTRPPG